MDIPTIYLDQNILGYIYEGSFPLDSIQNVQWVYSNTHFSEFKGSNLEVDFLNILTKLDASYLSLDLDKQFKPLGTAKINRKRSPSQNFNEYVETLSSSNLNIRVFDELIASLNGGRILLSAESVAENTFSFIDDLKTRGLITEVQVTMFRKQKEEYSRFLKCLFREQKDIVKIRKKMGIPSSGLTNISGDSVFQQIWNVVESHNDVDIDSFFGFSGVGVEELPLCSGIVRCCAILDIIGFHSERKCRKADKIANVMSDSQHIANGAFCTAIISNDRALVERAKAIYEYKGISTKLFHYSN
ncbi:hypothetical protein [Psychromonas sp. Urea-02u-13]|uniref:hypothetical protein n=1 Tax=Psychromonas sp. Urea-02u-13 TaxID=2058326 RepID=UPI000C32E675|nr:hypothetical protein [Psychromonas sp. Urea-02u-13]PKG37244.1 hypothetical protein CXF74_19930 [Psychromonas sp. Urea-02u-13]